MSNADTVNSIDTNLRAILTAQNFQVENLSFDSKTTTRPLIVLIRSEDFGENSGEAPKYNWVNYAMAIAKKETNVNIARESQSEWTHKIRDNVTASALNVGDLSSSLLVSKVLHQNVGEPTDQENLGLYEIAYRLRIRYREI